MDNKQDAIDKVMVSAILFKYKVPVDEAKLIGAFIERLEKERDEYMMRLGDIGSCVSNGR